MTTPDNTFRSQVNQETARIAWKELLRFFAGGLVIAVSPHLDMLEVALQISQDNKTLIEQWLSDGTIAKVSDELAREWLDADAVLWAVVIKPWILVQLPGHALS